MYKTILKSADKLELFYKKLVKIEDNFLSNNYRVRTLNCLEAEFEGKKVVKSSEWEQNHNYKGVYDMILNKNRYLGKAHVMLAQLNFFFGLGWLLRCMILFKFGTWLHTKWPTFCLQKFWMSPIVLPHVSHC